MFLQLCDPFSLYLFIFSDDISPLLPLCLLLGLPQLYIAIPVLQGRFNEFGECSQSNIVGEDFILIKFFNYN